MKDYRTLEDALLTDDFKEFQKVARSGLDINDTLDSVGNILHLYIDIAGELSYEPKKMIDFLVKSGININAQTKTEKLTPLRYAINYKRVDICKILIQHGCKVELADNDGNTPLLEAVSEFRGESELAEIIKLLLQAGADIKRENDHGVSPLQYAKDAGESIDMGGDPKEWDVRPVLIESGIKI